MSPSQIAATRGRMPLSSTAQDQHRGAAEIDFPGRLVDTRFGTPDPKPRRLCFSQPVG